MLPELSHVWRAYLRGQIILGLVIFLVVWIGLTLLGVQNSLALGLLGGLLEFVPTLGPVISAGVAILVAFFQPSNYLGLGAWQFALAVLILMILQANDLMSLTMLQQTSALVVGFAACYSIYSGIDYIYANRAYVARTLLPRPS